MYKFMYLFGTNLFIIRILREDLKRRLLSLDNRAIYLNLETSKKSVVKIIGYVHLVAID